MQAVPPGTSVIHSRCPIMLGHKLLAPASASRLLLLLSVLLSVWTYCRRKQVPNLRLALAAFLCVAHGITYAQTDALLNSPNVRRLQPNQQMHQIVKNERWSATVDSKASGFVVTGRSAKSEKLTWQVSLPYEVAEVDQVSIWGDYLVIRGMLNNALGEIVVLSGQTGHVADEFRAYWPNLSLESGLIVFTKDYPIHFVDGTSDHYLLYRLGRPAAENHAPGPGPLKSRPTGIPLYPLNAGNQNFDNINQSGSVDEQLSAGFFWDKPGKNALTLNSKSGQYSLVLMSFESEQAEIRIRTVSPGELCPSGEEKPCVPGMYLQKAVFTSAENGNALVVATFGYPQSAQSFTKTFPFSEFLVAGRRSLSHPNWTGTAN